MRWYCYNKKLHSQHGPDLSLLILHHLSESITTDAIAKELFMSRSHLSHSFKAETGMALSDFIMQKKIEEAKKLLSLGV